jgi:hypothetical protein
MVVEATVLGGDRPRSDEEGGGCSGYFRSGRGTGTGRQQRAQDGGGGAGRSARGGRRPGGAGWLGRPKAEAQGRFSGGGPKGGKGELAGSGGRRGGPQLGRIRSRARIQKKFFSNFNLFLEFGRTLKICTRRFRKKFDMRIFPKIF